jgi:lysophospholipase L1-like esterase
VKKRFCRRASSGLLAGLVLAGSALLTLTLDSGTAAADTAPVATSGFYLALGASASVGFQPTQTAPHGEVTDDGYANDVVAYESSRGVTLSLTQLGCPGESTPTMVSGEDHCYDGDGSQLADAVAFLESRRNQAGIVTVDLGFNDLHACLLESPVSAACVNTEMDTIAEQLPSILSTLQAAAGPQVTFVGMDHYNPYLADAIHPSWGKAYANRSKVLLADLNEELSSIYAGAGIAMAQVSQYFTSYGPSRGHLRLGDVSSDVIRTCDLTWMCAAKPYGPNMHPNDQGYAMIAAAIESQLPEPW